MYVFRIQILVLFIFSMSGSADFYKENSDGKALALKPLFFRENQTNILSKNQSLGPFFQPWLAGKNQVILNDFLSLKAYFYPVQLVIKIDL